MEVTHFFEMNSAKKPIGIFDSGIGGLTVFKEIRKILPGENLIYFGDTARVPYGNKSKETIIRYSKEITRFLVGSKVKMIVVACNTASSMALRTLRKEFELPVFGVIGPGAMSAYKKSNGGPVAVIGTAATIQSRAYSLAINNLNKTGEHIEIIEQACPLLVPLVEEGWVYSDVTAEVVRRYLKPVIEKKPSCLILGCTHYPIIKKLIVKEIGKTAVIIDSGKEVALELKRFLTKNNMLNKSGVKAAEHFFVSDAPEKFKILGENFLGKKIRNVKVIRDFFMIL